MSLAILRVLGITVIVEFLLISGTFAQTWNPDYTIGTTTGNYAFSYQQTPDPIVAIYPAALTNPSAVTYLWYSSASPILNTTNFTSTGVTTASYTFSGPLTQTTYFACLASSSSGGSVWSNVVKINLVSINWEDYNYVREHTVDTIGMNNWEVIDQLPIGEKFESTQYLDGLGRSVEQVSRQTATPAQAGGAWGDNVTFSEYDALGRQPVGYLPYTTTTQSGKFKTTQLTEQPQYYANPNTYNETSAYQTITFDNSPLNRVVNVKESGAAWASAPGNGASFDVNQASDSVQIWTADYVQGDPPVNGGMYPAGSLVKTTIKDENGNQVVSYIDYSGKIILKKVQAVPAPATGHTGWICTYFIFDSFEQLRFQIQPMGVEYLNQNGWSFSGSAGATVLAEQCYQYSYDSKRRTIYKKLPGVAAMNILYDVRDRVVFTQDGNQSALSTPQWTAYLYDYLDRKSETLLYNTTESVSSLQNDISNAQTTTTLTTPTNPISAANLANSAVTTVLKYLYYDNYSFSGAYGFYVGSTNTSAYSTSNPNVLPISLDNRVLDQVTGSSTLILGTTTYLNETHYYDEKGRLFQTLGNNIKGGEDISTHQMHFDGRLLSAFNLHNAPGTGYSNFATLTMYVYDQVGRISSVQKQIGTNAFKTISAYTYDDMSRISIKHLDPNYNNPNSGEPDLESLNYTYNIHNQITGINKDYALKTSADYSQWGHFFGLYLGYDNRDGTFNAAQLNGQVTGQMWNTQGDATQRKYDYSYDNANRLINAAYNEQLDPGDGWSNSQMDFSVSGNGSQIAYDLNGNLLAMTQRGIIPGTPTPITIDDLRYTYNSNSNKLQSVADMMTVTSANGLNGDFTNGTNGSGVTDYIYDNNGNLLVDLNKNIQSLNNGAAGTNGVHFNFLDKPDQIRLAGQRTMEIVYNADGRMLQRAFIPETGGLSTVTTYIDQFVYQSRGTLTLSSTAPFSVGAADTLDYMSFEEGRVRMMTPTTTTGLNSLTENGNLTLPVAGTMGVWDYYIVDHQNNVRMILTEETHSAVNTCTMETDSAAVEDPVFGQSGPANEVETTRAKTPAGWQSVNTSASVSQLGNLVGYNVGPNSLQKVMAGDQVTASVQYYYQSVSGNSNPNIVANILNILAGAIGGPASAGTVAEGQASAITTELGNSTAFLSAVNPANPPANTPQAYLTILFFDERFNLVSAEDGGVMQQQVASSWSTTTPPLAFANVKAPKNGYVFIYVSNLSDQTVYFDNLAIGITAGKIIEEDHYYSFGLKIAGISSKKLGDSGEGTLKNNFLYNGKEYFDEGGLDWLDYGLRNYDPQVGRFVEMDPLMDHYSYLSPYQYAGNDPIANIDKNGMGIFDVVDDAVEGTGDAVEGAGDVVQSTKAVSQVADIAMTVRSTVTVVSTAEQVLNVTTIVLNVAATATHFINTSITSQAVGDDLSRESLSRNPDFDGLTLGNLRNMIRTNGENLEEWMVNISAGLLLEDMYGAFSGLTKNYSSSTIFFPSGGLLPIARIIVPDFIPGVQNAENPNRVAEEGGIVEVKAIGEAITSSTSNWQIKAEGLKVASAEVVTNGLDDPRALNPTAGELKIASITFVVPSDKWVDPSLIADMTALGVNVFVSYPYLNLKTGKIVFSTPEKLNFISPTQPYKVQGNINGITPEPKKAADRWRVNQKNDIDGPQ